MRIVIRALIAVMWLLAPILNTLRRMVSIWARAYSVPFSPRRRRTSTRV